MPYTGDEEEATEEVEETEAETEDEESEETEEAQGDSEQSGNALDKLNDMLGGAGINLGQLIDDATEDKGGMIKTAGDLIGGFLNKNKD